MFRFLLPTRLFRSCPLPVFAGCRGHSARKQLNIFVPIGALSQPMGWSRVTSERCRTARRSALPAFLSIESHSRFGRGRGNGTARRSTAVLFTWVVSWVEAGLRKAAIGSLGGGLGTEEALGIEPVTSSLAGASLPPLVLFRIAKKPNTRIATTAIPCRVRRLGVSQGTAKRCCIIEPPVSPMGILQYRCLTVY